MDSMDSMMAVAAIDELFGGLLLATLSLSLSQF